MDQQLINNIVQVVVLVVGAAVAWFLRNSNEIKAAAKDNQAAQTTIDVLNKVATYVVHELQAGNLDNSQKRQIAIDQITTTLHTLGLKNVSGDVIAGAVESAVSAMHLAWDKETVIKTEPINVTAKLPAQSSNSPASQQLTYYPDSQLAVDGNGATYTLTRLGTALTKEVAAKQEAGGGPINE
jgi:LL-H family phage holin